MASAKQLFDPTFRDKRFKESRTKGVKLSYCFIMGDPFDKSVFAVCNADSDNPKALLTKCKAEAKKQKVKQKGLSYGYMTVDKKVVRFVPEVKKGPLKVAYKKYAPANNLIATMCKIVGEDPEDAPAKEEAPAAGGGKKMSPKERDTARKNLKDLKKRVEQLKSRMSA